MPRILIIDDDDAVRIANESKYGLAGMVSSGSLERSLAIARRVRAGGAIIPFSTSVTRLSLPTYGGYVASKGAVDALTLAMAGRSGWRGY